MSDEQQAAVRELSKKCDELAASASRLQELRYVCGEAYQMAGALDGPVEALDNLSAAAQGKPLPHKTFLPIHPKSPVG